jgi:hypothetical protein
MDAAVRRHGNCSSSASILLLLGETSMRFGGYMAAVLSLSLAASQTPTLAADAGFVWKDTPGDHLDLTYNGKPTLRYMYKAIDESSPEARAATFKPFHHVWSPGGETQLTNGAGAKLYPHHHGVFYGFNKCAYDDGKEADVWHCTFGCYQSHEKQLEQHADADRASHKVAIDWHGKDGKAFAHEQREMAVTRDKNGDVEGWQIDFRSHLEPANEKVHVDGDPQHAGFHFRAVQEVADQKPPQTYYLRTTGKGQLGGTINWDPKQPDSDNSQKAVNRPWDAMSIIVGGQRYTILYIDHLQNPKPARYSEREYGRFGSYFVADVTKDKPLDVKYRLWVQPGEMTVDQCQKMHDAFVK